jgi:hypothetical protein
MCMSMCVCVCVCVYLYVYVYVYVLVSLSLSLSLSVCVCVYVCVCIFFFARPLLKCHGPYPDAPALGGAALANKRVHTGRRSGFEFADVSSYRVQQLVPEARERSMQASAGGVRPASRRAHRAPLPLTPPRAGHTARRLRIPFALLPDISFDFAALLLVFVQQLPVSLQHMHEPRAVGAAAHFAQGSPHLFVRLRQLRSGSDQDVRAQGCHRGTATRARGTQQGPA